MEEVLFNLFLYWMIYCLLGWLVETIYCSVPQGHFIERGFLNGPICPIYGFGAIFILSVLKPYINNLFAVFILGMISTSILEYVTSYLMEKLFKMKWWDYSDHKFNIRGRVCLLNSVLFGILCIVLTELIHPPIKFFVNEIPLTLKYISVVVLSLITSVDIFASVRSIINLNHKFELIYQLKEQILEKLEHENVARKLNNLRESRDNFVENRLDNLKEFKESLTEMKENIDIDIDKVVISFHEKLKALQSENKYIERRILLAFPKLKSIKYNELLQEMRKSMKEFRQEHSKKKKN